MINAKVRFLSHRYVVGAGDSFNGAYLASLINGFSQSISLDYGHKLATKVIKYNGAIIPVDL